MPTIVEKLNTLEKQKQKLLAQLEKVRANKTFICGCGKRHRIKECVAIQTHWYTNAHGCTGGDFWTPGEIQIICPETDHKNRIMFDYYDVPWEKRDHYTFNPEIQLRRMYLHLFKDVIDDYDEDKREWWNNYYIDEHRSKFELCDKYEKEKQK